MDGGELFLVLLLGIALAVAWKLVHRYRVQQVEKQRRRAEAEAALRLQYETEAQRAYPLLARAITSLTRLEYIAASEVAVWRAEHAPTLELAKQGHLADYLPATEADRFRTWCRQLCNLERTVRDLNESFVARRMAEDAQPFDQVERYPLTDRQRRSIVTDEDTTLVIAGAGTGKTSTIIGKVDYLVRRRLAKPGEILVLAYGRKASDELKDRMKAFGDARNVTISTFHALGLRIVGEVEGKRPSLSPLADDDRLLKRFIRDRVREMLADPTSHRLLVRFLAHHLDEEDQQHPTNPARTGDEHIREQRARGLRAINGLKLKSREEVQIANWLTLNGIRWEYERPYVQDTATPWHRQYRPDLYLPDYDIYIEHFGIDRRGQTAPQIDAAAYSQAMNWKRRLHQQHGTTLIETFSYFKQEGGLVERLEELLCRHGVHVSPLSQGELDEITAEANRPFSDFVNLLAQFLALYKGNGADRALTQARARSERDRVFLEIFGRLFEAYSAKLRQDNQIDFNDMINRARHYVQAGRFRGSYSHIVIDEFQDISENRLGLLQDLRAQRAHGRLFAVGDDWQSIYRFAGSDVGIITHLPQRVGTTERVDLDIAFRYAQDLLDVTSAFVMENPGQLRKALRAHQRRNGISPICVVFQESGMQSAVTPESLDLVLADIVDQTGGESAHAFMLGRYHRNEPETIDQIQHEWERQGLSIEFLTAHSSKGREADFIIVVGLEAGEYGFPANIADDPVMRLVLSDPESFLYAEERRLFYVAMTRARQRVYLIAPKDNASPFVERDILGEKLIPYVETIGEISERHRCPQCQGATIRRTQGQYGAFWGCSHFPLCHGRLDTCPDCREGGLVRRRGEDQKIVYCCTDCHHAFDVCPSCWQGYLSKRTGPYGDFLGCTRWKRDRTGCNYTRNA